MSDPELKNDIKYFILNVDDIYAEEMVYFLGSTLKNAVKPDASPTIVGLALNESLHSFAFQTLVSSEDKPASNIATVMSKRSRYRDVAKDFLQKYFLEIQNILCKDYSKITPPASSGSNEDTGQKSTGMAQTAGASGLAAWLASTFSIHNSLAIAVATSVIMLIVTAGRGAFCKMDFKEFWQSVETSSNTIAGKKPDQDS